MYLIASFLPKETAAALALVSRYFKALLGPRALEFHDAQDIYGDGPRTKWEFLKLLERDCQCLVACPFCIILHFPNLPCERGSQLTPTVSDHPMVLPKRLRYNMVRAIARHHIRGGENSKIRNELLGLASNMRVLLQSGVRLVHSTMCRVVGGNLLSRSQTIVAPLVTGLLTEKS